MIQHTIVKYKQIVSAPTSGGMQQQHPRHHQPRHPYGVIDSDRLGPQGTHGLLLGKYQYNEFLKNCPFKLGDFVVPTDAPFPNDVDDVWVVIGIQELWYMCGGNHTEGLKPLYIQHRLGARKWVNYTKYKLCTDRSICFDYTPDTEVPPSPI